MDSNQPTSPGTPPPTRWQPPIIERPPVSAQPRPAAPQVTPPQDQPVREVPVAAPSATPPQPEPSAPPAAPAQPLQPVWMVKPPTTAVASVPDIEVPADAAQAALPDVAELTALPLATAETETPPAIPSTPAQPFYPAPTAATLAVEPTEAEPPKPKKFQKIVRGAKTQVKKYRKVLTVAGCLVLLVGLVFSGVKVAAFANHAHKTAVSNARDDKRTAALKSLQTNLEAYYTLHGDYPTLSEINNAAFRGQNLPNLTTSSLQDPAGSSQTLTVMPTKHSYSYRILPAGCDNQKVKCVEYELAAVLDNGQTTAKMNIAH